MAHFPININPSQAELAALKNRLLHPFEDITSVSAVHLYGSLRFQKVRQDRRIYFALMLNDRQTGTLTTAERAKETIAYWRSKGWITDGQ